MIGSQSYRWVLRSGLACGVVPRVQHARTAWALGGSAGAAPSFTFAFILPLAQERHISTESLPRIAQPSLWKSIVPKPLRSNREESMQKEKTKKKDWNPATFFIAMVMLIGSQAIQMISLRSSFAQFSNQTEAKLAKLRQVVGAIQRGEDVDVEAILGTGNQTAEREWEEVIRELEREDEVYRRKRKQLEKSQLESGTSSKSSNSGTKPER